VLVYFDRLQSEGHLVAEAQANCSYTKAMHEVFCCSRVVVNMLQLPLFPNSERMNAGYCVCLRHSLLHLQSISKHLEAHLDEIWAEEAVRQYTIEVYSLQ